MLSVNSVKLFRDDMTKEILFDIIFKTQQKTERISYNV